MVWAACGEQPVGPSPGGQRPTPAQTAQRVQDGMPWQPAVRELLDGLLAGAPIDEQEPVRVAPRFDAYLAAVVEHISAARGAAAPGWVKAPTRFLPTFWWPDGNPAFTATCLVQSPAAFRRRGIFIGATTLSRV
ncbi:MAG: hypothetical protein M3486_09155 [Actinomycetota bacterium]|nr:hypothetical protein [Actinomycetota bacterium]